MSVQPAAQGQVAPRPYRRTKINPDNPTNPTNQTKLHPGIVNPNNAHCTSAHSPDPRKISPSAFCNGNASSINANPGPHSGTRPSGKFCNHKCRPATAAPSNAATPASPP